MIWQRGCVTVLFMALCLFSNPVLAQDIDLERAVELWLADDDAQSLPALAELAEGGNADARILLARLESQDLGPSFFRKSLSRDETRALFRTKSSGLFPKTWLQVEAENGNELATLLLASHQPDVDASLIKNLFDIGEAQASDHPTRILALYGTKADRQAIYDGAHVLDELRPYLRYLNEPPEKVADGIWALRKILGEEARVTAENLDDEAMARTLALGYGFGSIAPENPHFDAVSNWVLNDPATRPIAAICNQSCPQDQNRCAMAALALSGGYYEVIRLDSPLERLIPQTKFLQSDRAEAMTLRRIAFQRTETDDLMAIPGELAGYSQCFADLILEVQNQ